MEITKVVKHYNRRGDPILLEIYCIKKTWHAIPVFHMYDLSILG